MVLPEQLRSGRCRHRYDAPVRIRPPPVREAPNRSHLCSCQFVHPPAWGLSPPVQDGVQLPRAPPVMARQGPLRLLLSDSFDSIPAFRGGVCSAPQAFKLLFHHAWAPRVFHIDAVWHDPQPAHRRVGRNHHRTGNYPGANQPTCLALRRRTGAEGWVELIEGRPLL